MKGWSHHNNGNDKIQDKVKSKEEQIKDLQQDILKLKQRNNPGDNSKIKILEAEINKLKN